MHNDNNDILNRYNIVNFSSVVTCLEIGHSMVYCDPLESEGERVENEYIMCNLMRRMRVVS